MFGRLGIREIIGDKMECHICGGFYRSVGTHAVQAHDISAATYKERFGLNKLDGLVGPATRALQAANAARPGHPGTAYLLARGVPTTEEGLRGARNRGSTEWRLKVGDRHRGIPLSAEHKAKVSATRHLRYQAISEAQKRAWRNLSPKVQAERRARFIRDAFRNSSRTHCIRGHPFAGANLRVRTARDGTVQRRCRTCTNLRAVTRRRKRKQASPPESAS